MRSKRFCPRMRQNGTTFAGDQKVEFKKSLKLYGQISLTVLTKVGINLVHFAWSKGSKVKHRGRALDYWSWGWGFESTHQSVKNGRKFFFWPIKTSGVCIIKLFTAVIYGFRTKLERLSLNTRLGWKGLPGTKFMIQAPGVNVIKIFTAVSYAC